MPSIATITSFYNFTALTVIRSAQVNTNFDTFRGHIIAVDPSTATSAATMTYDLGSNDHAWRNIYAKGLHVYGDTVGQLHQLDFITSMLNLQMVRPIKKILVELNHNLVVVPLLQVAHQQHLTQSQQQVECRSHSQMVRDKLSILSVTPVREQILQLIHK